MTPGLDPRARDLIDAYLDDRVTRRQFVQGALWLGLTVSGAGALLAGCSSHTSKPKQLSGRIQVLVGFGAGNSPPQLQVEQVLAQAFLHLHPKVEIDFLRAASPSDARAQIVAMTSRGAAPDLVLPIGLGELSRLVDQKTWLDLRPFFDRDGLTLSSFVPEARAAASMSSYYGRGAKTIVGVPLGVHDHALAFNQSLFSKAGGPVPLASWSDASWAVEGSFLQAAQALTLDAAKKHPGDAGFTPSGITQFGVGHIRPELFLYGFGGRIYDASTRKVQLGSPEAVRGIQFAADLVNVHHVQPSPAQLVTLGARKGNEEQTAWRSAKLAMIAMCSCELTTEWATDLAFAWTGAALPAGPVRRLGLLEVDVGAIAAASTRHDLAWEVLKFFTVDPANERRLSSEGFGAMPGLSANTDAFGRDITQKLPKVSPVPWIAGLSSAYTDDDAWFPAFAEVKDLMASTFSQILTGTTVPPAMDQLQQQAQAKVDDWFSTHKLPG